MSFDFLTECTGTEEPILGHNDSHFIEIDEWSYLDDTYSCLFQLAVNLWKKGFVKLQVKGKWELYHPIKDQEEK
jgi:hypothetical protein